MTTPDNPAYENKPSNWNATHAVTFSAVGSEISGAFSNANGVSFGLSAGAVTASHNALTTAALSNHSHGNPQLNLTNLSGTTASNSAGFTLSLSAAAGGAGDGVNIIAAGTQTANTTGTVLFSNSNGITFGMSNSSIVTASHNGLTSQSNQAFSAAGGSSAFQTLSFNNANGVSFSNNGGAVEASIATSLTNIRISAGTTSNLLSAVTFANGNGISFGLDASTVTASHNALTSQSNQNVTAGNGGFAFQTLSFSNANNFSFGTSAGSAITGSYTVPTVTNSSWTASDGVTSLTIARLAFTNANGVTLTLSTTTGGSATLVGSHNGLTSQSNQNVTAGNGGFAFQTLSFSNVNGISFGTSAGSAITASHNALTTAAASDHSHGNPQLNLTNLSGTTASNSAGFTLSLSANAPGAAAENNWFNLLGNNTAGNTTASGSTIGLSGINVTLSGTNGSVVNISGPAPLTYSGFAPYANLDMITVATSQGTLSVEPIVLPNVQFDRIGFVINNTNSSNSSGSHTLSFRVGFYTRNVSTLSLVASQSTSYGVTHSGTAGSYSLYSGMRILTMGMTTTLTEGRYWLAVNSNTTSGGANGSYSMYGISQTNNAFAGVFSVATNTTQQFTLGQGIYTASTTGIPGSIAFSHLRGSDSAAFRSPVIQLISSTV